MHPNNVQHMESISSPGTQKYQKSDKKQKNVIKTF